MVKIIEGKGFKLEAKKDVVEAVLKVVHRDLVFLVLEYPSRRVSRTRRGRREPLPVQTQENQ